VLPDVWCGDPLLRVIKLLDESLLHGNKDSWTTGLEIQVPATKSMLVAKFFGFKPSTVEPPEETIVRILARFVSGVFSESPTQPIGRY
jgi:hypothetical protein